MSTLAPWSEPLAALQRDGAQQMDPLRLHYLQRLAGRLDGQHERTQALLSARLMQGIADLRMRLVQAHADAPPAQDAQQAADPRPGRSPLSELTHYLAQAHPGSEEPSSTQAVGAGGAAWAAGAPPELRAVRQFRRTWSRLSAGQQLTRAIDQAPKNAGPINSQMLVLRSLGLMQEISPDYFNHFMSYADALLCLDQPAARSPRAKPRAPKIAG